MVHLPTEPSICDRCDRFRRSRSAIGRRPRMDHASCPVRHQGAGWHPLQAYRAIVDLHPLWPFRSSNRADRRFTQRRCVPAPRPTPQSGTHWTWPVDDFHRIAQGHQRNASCPAFGTRSSAIARRAMRTTIPLRRLHRASAMTIRNTAKSLLQKVKIFKACRYLAIPPPFGYRGQGYEKRQVPPRSSR
jgi:hypothetical protein